jgi:hypothetical protein
MGKLNVRNGTPAGTEHLCKNCHHGQFTTGYRESDILVVCTNVYPSIRPPFVVHECSDFEDKDKPDWEQMEKLAIQIQPVRVSKKTRGFQSPDVPLIRGSVKPEYEPAAEEVEDEEFDDVDAVAAWVLTP